MYYPCLFFMVLFLQNDTHEFEVPTNIQEAPDIRGHTASYNQKNIETDNMKLSDNIQNRSEKYKQKQSEYTDLNFQRNENVNKEKIINGEVIQELFHLLGKLNLTVSSQNSDILKLLGHEEESENVMLSTADENYLTSLVYSAYDSLFTNILTTQINMINSFNNYYESETTTDTVDLEYDYGNEDIQLRADGPMYASVPNQIDEDYDKTDAADHNIKVFSIVRSTPQKETTATKMTTTKTVHTTQTRKQSTMQSTTEIPKFLTLPSHRTLPLEDEVIVIRRVKGVWLGGKCRCNYMIRSWAPQFKENLYIKYYFLLCLYYFTQ